MTDPYSKELTVLNYIEQNASATQRELSEYVGVSLGAINLLLKKMVKKGLVKVERLQPNTVKYLITPAGFASKVEKTYRYVVRTYTEISRLRARIVMAADTAALEHAAERVIFYGKHDELMELIHDLIRTKSFSVDADVYDTADAAAKHTKTNKDVPVIIWNNASETELKKHGVPSINIMGMLVV